MRAQMIDALLQSVCRPANPAVPLEPPALATIGVDPEVLGDSAPVLPPDAASGSVFVEVLLCTLLQSDEGHNRLEDYLQ